MSVSKGLNLIEITKSFGKKKALNGVSFAARAGAITAILGPSGCGKSTLLAIIAGLEIPDSGDVLWDGSSLKDTPPHQRGFGLMFQDYALFPHMNVSENLAFGLRMARVPENEIRSQVKEALEWVGLVGFEERDVNTLSGGEQQRVALARSLAPRPRLLMLDEPLGSLDRTLRERLIIDLREILRRIHQTALYVTHDQEEAFTLADQVVVMNAGSVEQIGVPHSIYLQPATLFVARFLGLNNLLTGIVTQKRGKSTVQTQIGRLPVQTPFTGEVTILIRPDAMRLDGSGTHYIEGKVLEGSFRGATSRALIDVNGVVLTFEFLTSKRPPAAGEYVHLSFDPGEAILVYPNSDK